MHLSIVCPTTLPLRVTLGLQGDLIKIFSMGTVYLGLEVVGHPIDRCNTCISVDDIIILQVRDEEDFVSQSAFDELEDKLQDK